MQNLTVTYTAEQLLEKTKEELQTLYAEIVGSEPKAKDTKQNLADAIIAKQAELAPVVQMGGEKVKTPGNDLEGDDKIIAENPDANPYELLEKGLSQEGFERLMLAQNDQIGDAPADKPKIDGDAPETKETPADYTKAIQPKPAAENLISQRREQMQNNPGDLDDVKRPQLIGKVTQLPGQTVAQAMTASTKTKSVDLSKRTTKSGGVKIQMGNGQPQVVSKATAERLMRLEPGKYRILS